MEAHSPSGLGLNCNNEEQFSPSTGATCKDGQCTSRTVSVRTYRPVGTRGNAKAGLFVGPQHGQSPIPPSQRLSEPQWRSGLDLFWPDAQPNYSQPTPSLSRFSPGAGVARLPPTDECCLPFASCVHFRGDTSQHRGTGDIRLHHIGTNCSQPSAQCIGGINWYEYRDALGITRITGKSTHQRQTRLIYTDCHIVPCPPWATSLRHCLRNRAPPASVAVVKVAATAAVRETCRATGGGIAAS